MGLSAAPGDPSAMPEPDWRDPSDGRVRTSRSDASRSVHERFEKAFELLGGRLGPFRMALDPDEEALRVRGLDRLDQVTAAMWSAPDGNETRSQILGPNSLVVVAVHGYFDSAG
jgi:hypothetical protein